MLERDLESAWPTHYATDHGAWLAAEERALAPVRDCLAEGDYAGAATLCEGACMWLGATWEDLLESLGRDAMARILRARFESGAGQ